MKKTAAAGAALVLVALACLLPSALSKTSSLNAGAVSSPPPYCHPCLFYGGDFDASGPSPNTLTNQDALTCCKASVYVPFAVPPDQTWTVTGLFSNVMTTVPTLAPPQIEWSISTGVSQGNGGTLIASGIAKATLTPTGRSWQGLNEYTALGLLNGNALVTLTSGHYWMTAVPVCTFVEVQQPCSGARYYISDVEDVPPPHAKGFESSDESYFEAPEDGWNYAETGGASGVCAPTGGCDKFSAGLLGRAQLN